ncbi:MAG: transposase, partial [Phycisphaerae bacterium]|nr:transposase [Phycisphaerae bacterium]
AALLDQHEANTGATVEVAVADKAYGTAENYKALAGRGVTPCIPHQRYGTDANGTFGRERFVYDRDRDCFHCPGGQMLKRRGSASEGRWRYRADNGVCASCALRGECTTNVHGRQLSRDVDQDVIDWADGCLTPSQRRWWMRRRKIRAEGSFADATNRHGYKRARWRGLFGVTIQNLLIATTQNLRKLLRRPGRAGPTCWRVLSRLMAPPARFISSVGSVWSRWLRPTPSGAAAVQ